MDVGWDLKKKSKQRATLDEVLASISDALFPEMLGEAEVKIDSVGSDGDTPLHIAVWRNDLHAVKVLIAAGANVDAMGDMGETPLHVAIGQKNISIVEALLEAGVRTGLRSEFDQTAIERAEKTGGEIAKLLGACKIGKA